MQRLTPELADTGGIEVLQWITVVEGEPELRRESYLPCKPDRFHRGRHRAPSVVPVWLAFISAAGVGWL